MATVKTLTYNLKKNVGNYENEDISITCEIHEGDDLNAVLNWMRSYAAAALHYNTPGYAPPNLPDSNAKM